MNKLYIKTIPYALMTSILLTGCGSKGVEVANYTGTIVEETKQNYISKNDEKDKIIQDTYIEEIKTKEESEETITQVETQEEIRETQEFTFFKDAKEELSGYIKSKDFKKLKEKGKYYVTTGIDFIFYDEPIKGVYFNDLTDDAKAIVIKDVKIIDDTIMKYYPDYKETIGSKYHVAADFLSDKYLKVLDKIKKYLGDKNYEVVGEIKDQILGDVKKGTDKTKDLIKDKYNNWKNKESN